MNERADVTKTETTLYVEGGRQYRETVTTVYAQVETVPPFAVRKLLKPEITRKVEELPKALE